MAQAKSARTLSQVFEEFLEDQEGRISPKTLSKYQSIIQLYESYLESYWPGHDGEYSKITEAGGTYCGTFGPEEATDGYGEFLGYFMPRKVMCGKDLMQAAGTVTKKLAKWLAEKGYVADTEDAQERASEAGRDLPAAQDVLDLLVDYLEAHAPQRHSDEIEDHFSIKRIEPGQLWLEPLCSPKDIVGPVPVPKKVTQLCQPDWDISGVVARAGKGWRLVEVWNVVP